MTTNMPEPEILQPVSENADASRETMPDRTMKLELFRVIIAALFLVLFAYDTWKSTDSALVFSQLDILNGAQWALLVVAIVLPIALWLVTCFLLWRRSRRQLMLGLLVAWMTSAALFIDMKFILGILGNM